MIRRGQIPETIGQRLRLTMDALGLRPVDVQTLTGFTSSRLSNYTSDRSAPPPRGSGAKLCKALGINSAWLYDGDIDALAHHVAMRIENLLDEGWTSPGPRKGIGRPPMSSRQRKR